MGNAQQNPELRLPMPPPNRPPNRRRRRFEGPNVPPIAIYGFGHEDYDYSEALRLGEVLVSYGRVMMIGAGGAGKTSLRHGLMKKLLPERAFSTLLADSLSVKYQWTGAAGQGWVEIDEEDEINEMATLLGRIIENKSLLRSGDNASAIQNFQPFTQPQSGGSKSTRSSSKDHSEVVKEIRERVITKARQAILHHRPHSEVLLNVWDSGGQVVFMNVLPAFLTKRTLFMLVFNAAKNLTTKLQFEARHAGKIVHIEDYQLNTIEMLLQWMASIHAHLTLRERGAKADPYPRVMLIGTHLDLLVLKGCTPEVVTKTTLDSLHSQYKDKMCADLLLPSPGYIVDNTTAGQDKEDPAFQTIRECVREFVTTNLTVRTPITWVFFRKVMQRISQAGKPVMRYSEVIEVANACSIPTSAVPSVLNFYHELGVFLHYSKIPTLREIIIAIPQWLVDHIAKLLTPHGFEDKGRERRWSLLRRKGILTETLYKEVLVHSILPPQALVDLLEHFLLAVPIETTRIHPYKGKEYFVPCMLNAPSQPTVPLSSNSDKTSAPIDVAKPIHLIFNTHYVPPGFYVRLLAAVARNTHCQVLFQHINRSTVTVAYQEVDEITLREHPDSIEVLVTRPAKGALNTPPFPQVCRDILIMIQSSTTEVYEWLPGVTVSTAFVCSTCSPSEVPYHFVGFNQDTLTTSTVRCQNEKLQVLGQCPLQQSWLKQPEQSSGVESIREQIAALPPPHSQISQKGVTVRTSEATTQLQMEPETCRKDITQRTPRMPLDFSGTTAVPKLVDLVEHVTITRWFDLGLALGVDDYTLQCIEHDTRGDCRTGLRRMFQEWLHSCEQPSWDSIILALRRIREKRLAAEICLKF